MKGVADICHHRIRRDLCSECAAHFWNGVAWAVVFMGCAFSAGMLVGKWLL